METIMSKSYISREDKFDMSSDFDSDNSDSFARDKQVNERVKTSITTDNSVFGKKQDRVIDRLKSSEADLVQVADIKTCSGVISVNKDLNSNNTVLAFYKTPSVYNDANYHSDKNFELANSTSRSVSGVTITMQTRDEDMILLEADENKKYVDFKEGIEHNTDIDNGTEGIYKVSPTTMETTEEMKTNKEKSTNLYINNQINEAIERGKILKSTKFDDDLLQFMKKKRLEDEDDNFVEDADKLLDSEVEDVES